MEERDNANDVVHEPHEFRLPVHRAMQFTAPADPSSRSISRRGTGTTGGVQIDSTLSSPNFQQFSRYFSQPSLNRSPSTSTVSRSGSDALQTAAEAQAASAREMSTDDGDDSGHTGSIRHAPGMPPVPPWAPQYLPATEELQRQDPPFANLIDYLRYLWLKPPPPQLWSKLSVLGDHSETFLRPHPLAHGDMHRWHESSDVAERRARIRGFIAFDMRLQYWYKKLVVSRKVSKQDFWRHYRSHIQAVLQGQPAFLSDSMYISKPVLIHLAPDSVEGRRNYESLLASLGALPSASLSYNRSSTNTQRIVSDGTMSFRSKATSPTPLHADLSTLYTENVDGREKGEQVTVDSAHFESAGRHLNNSSVQFRDNLQDLIIHDDVDTPDMLTPDGKQSTSQEKKRRSRRLRRWNDWLLFQRFIVFVLLFVFTICAPLALWFVYYVNVLQLIQSAIPSLFMAATIWVVSIVRLKRIPGVLAGTDSIDTTGGHSRFRKFRAYLDILLQWTWLSTQDYIYESYQLIVSVVAAYNWIYYSYNVSYRYHPQPDGSSAAYYEFNVSSAAYNVFLNIEIYVVMSLGVDYLLRFSSSPIWQVFFWSRYSLVDIFIFIAVAYVPFFCLDFTPARLALPIYNAYLLSGAFRFLRLRRAFVSLDHAHVKQDPSTGKVHMIYMLGPLPVSSIKARIILLGVNLTIYILATSAIFLALEFPCISMVSDGLLCSFQLQQFHIDIYFVVVTLATVGYGDVYAETSPGRAFAVVTIVGAVVNIPRVVNDFNAIADDRAKKEKAKSHRLAQANLAGNEGEDVEMLRHDCDIARAMGELAWASRRWEQKQRSESESNQPRISDHEEGSSRHVDDADADETLQAGEEGNTLNYQQHENGEADESVTPAVQPPVKSTPSMSAKFGALLDPSDEMSQRSTLLQLELLLLRHHSNTQILQLCERWNIEPGKREHAATALLYAMFAPELSYK